jgi:DNA polymerase
MDSQLATMQSADLASLLGWWQSAGVDSLVGETPRNWLATVAKTPAHQKPAQTIARAAPLPETLDDFLLWLATDAGVPGGGPPAQRMAPAGNPRAGLMVLIDMPEAGDVAAGKLLAGPACEMFEKMLAAINLDRSSIWFAPMIPSRMLASELSPGLTERIAEIARHHVRLASPKKLWLLGRAASRAILGMDEGEARGRLHLINQMDAKTDVIASVHPRVLLQTPKRKAEVWADMQKLFKD